MQVEAFDDKLDLAELLFPEPEKWSAPVDTKTRGFVLTGSNVGL